MAYQFHRTRKKGIFSTLENRSPATTFVGRYLIYKNLKSDELKGNMFFKGDLGENVIVNVSRRVLKWTSKISSNCYKAQRGSCIKKNYKLETLNILEIYQNQHGKI